MGAAFSGLGLPEAALFVTVMAWAVNFSIMKYATGIWSPYAFNLGRLVAASLALLVVWAFVPRVRAFDRRDFRELLVLAVSGHVLFQFGFLYGIHASSAASAAIIVSLAPVAIAAIAWLTGAEAFCRHTAIGLLLATAGVVMVSGAETSALAQAGNLGVLGAAVCWALFTVRAAPLAAKYGAVRITVWSVGLGTVMLSIPGLFILAPADVVGAPPVIWGLAVVSGILAVALAHVMWNYAASRVGATLTGVYSNVAPIPALLIAWLWLGESLPPAKLAGTAAILAGIAFVRAHRARPGGRVIENTGFGTSAAQGETR